METTSFTFKTLAEKGNGDFRDRGSKFLGFSFPVNNREEIKEHLKALKEQHPKANHHCYAWRLGTTGNDFRANDNGEPSGSAGRPILGQIDSAGLTNVLIVVVRYFGGTLLGIPGLINAYKTTASESLAQSTIVEKAITTNYQLQFDYTHLNDIMILIRKYQAEIKRQQMELFCVYEIAVPIRQQKAFEEQAGATHGLIINVL